MKTLSVRIIPNAKKNEVAEKDDHLKVRVKAPASKGKANRELIVLLADFFGVKKSSIRIIKGEKSREKLIEVDIEDD